MRIHGLTIATFALLAGLATAQIGTVNLNVNVKANASPGKISPLIYGANFASPADARLLDLPLNRNGGNATTRYNWQQDATSSGSDWYFLSHSNGGTQPGQSVDDWITGNNTSGAPPHTLSMVTIPIIGWVAKIQPNRDSMWSFSVSKYGAQQAVEPWHADAGNGLRPNGTKVTGNNPTDANIAVPISYQQDWLNHLTGKFGTAANGGVAYYLLDNEPALWHETHRDVLPNGTTMNDLFVKGRDAALLVKSIDPTAQVCGPEEWGWLGYLYSGSDFIWLQEHNWQGNPPDRQAHGNMDCAAYLLQQFNLASISAGKRLLDVFTLHYYPQGSFSWTDNSQQAQLWRNRATRSLWDPNYTDESWIGQKINLINRMKGWVNTYYPNTKLGITEYIWGDDNNMSAAIAQADAFGIMGREGIDLATRWVSPAAGTHTYRMFQLFRNYDGDRGSFGDRIQPVSAIPDPDTLTAYAAVRSSTNETTIVLIHKRLTGTAPVTVNLVNSAGIGQKAKVYQVTSTGLAAKPSIPAVGTQFSISLPPQSVTMLVIPYGRGSF